MAAPGDSEVSDAAVVVDAQMRETSIVDGAGFLDAATPDAADSQTDAAADSQTDAAAACTASSCRLGEACQSASDCSGAAVCERGFCTIEGYSYVPAGTFTMGASCAEEGRHKIKENGPFTVQLTRSLLVKQTTVTQREWREMFGNDPSFHNCGDQCPVESVTWWEMLEYANALSKKEGLEACYQLSNCMGEIGTGCKDGVDHCNAYSCDREGFDFDVSCEGYRLPTEAEWEYFARAGTTTPFITESGGLQTWFPGSGLDPELDKIAWYPGNSEVAYTPAFDCSGLYEGAPQWCGTHPVGQKNPNAWGLYDITGNVWESVWDRAGSYPGAEAGTCSDTKNLTLVDPKEPGAIDTNADGVELWNRRMRGGPFNAWGKYMRVAYRTATGDATRYYNNGFRLVRSLPMQ